MSTSSEPEGQAPRHYPGGPFFTALNFCVLYEDIQALSINNEKGSVVVHLRGSPQTLESLEYGPSHVQSQFLAARADWQQWLEWKMQPSNN